MKEYNVTVNGYPTTMQLSDHDAEARGLTSKDVASPAQQSASAVITDDGNKAPRKAPRKATGASSKVRQDTANKSKG